MCEHYACDSFPAKDVVIEQTIKDKCHGSPGEGCCHLRVWCSSSGGAVHSGQEVTASRQELTLRSSGSIFSY